VLNTGIGVFGKFGHPVDAAEPAETISIARSTSAGTTRGRPAAIAASGTTSTSGPARSPVGGRATLMRGTRQRGDRVSSSPMAGHLPRRALQAPGATSRYELAET